MNKILILLKKYWWVVALILVFIAMRIIKSFKKMPEDKDKAAAIIMDSVKGFTDQKKIELKNVAIQLSHHLGTAYEWWIDPRRWSENDEEAFLLLQHLTQKEFDLVSKFYFELYGKGRNLSVDLAMLLDSKYYEQLKVK